MITFESIARALIESACAWLPEPAIAAAVGVDAAELAAAVAAMVAARLVERWDRPDGPVLTLAPLGAAQLGVRLVETAGGEIYRWSPDAVSVRTRRISHAQRRRMDDHAELLAQVPDRPARRPARGEPPMPRVLLWGVPADAWHEEHTGPRPIAHCALCLPRTRRRRNARARFVASCRCGLGLRPRRRIDRCPACGGGPLPATWYCLRCDRWGMDGYFRRRLGAKTRRPEPRRKAG